MAHYYLKAPFGMVTIQMHQDAIKLILSAQTTVPDNIGETHPMLQLAAMQVNRYFIDAYTPMTSILPIESLGGTPYQQSVWRAIANIPAGETRTYGALAESIQSCPRALANACGANRIPILIPCHRVVSKQGIGGFMRGNPDGLAIKRWLLQHEGIDYA